MGSVCTNIFTLKNIISEIYLSTHVLELVTTSFDLALVKPFILTYSQLHFVAIMFLN